MPVPLVADYVAEREAFANLLQPECDTNILFYSGASGSGKTTLYNACLHQAHGHLPVIPIQLRNSATTIAEIFQHIGNRLGWERLPGFTAQVAALHSPPTIKIIDNFQLGVGNQIQTILNVAPADREQRRAALTQACFLDFQTLTAPFLIAFDTYEAAIPEVQEWITGPFLTRAADTPALRVLITGQCVPPRQEFEWQWGRCCTHHELYGVPEAELWLPIVEALECEIQAPHLLSWLMAVCELLNGSPLQIMQVIQSHSRGAP